MLNKLGMVAKWKTHDYDYEAWPKGYDDFMMAAYGHGTVPPGYALVTAGECPPPGFKRLGLMMKEYYIGLGSLVERGTGNEPVFQEVEREFPGYEELICALFAYPAMAGVDTNGGTKVLKNASVAFNIYGKPDSAAL